MYIFQKLKYTTKIQRETRDSHRDTGVNSFLNPPQLFSIHIYQRVIRNAQTLDCTFVCFELLVSVDFLCGIYCLI